MTMKIAGMVGAMVALVATTQAAEPLLQMRLVAADTATYETWQSNFCAFAAHPGCCDEVWFSTGIGTPMLDWHRAHAEVLTRAARDLRAVGIVPSLQFQGTLGHGDAFGRPETSAAKTWTGWTDRNGLEDRFCNCPRQPDFQKYVGEVSRIYAAVGFHGLWVDDDLRIHNHKPADNAPPFVGCWCDTCLGAFNAEAGASWTRSALAEAMAKDAALAARWQAFSISSLCEVARTISRAFREVSPETMMALQRGDDKELVCAVLDVLRRESGRPVGYRPGGGAYREFDGGAAQVFKSLNSARFRGTMGDSDWICEWTPEIESWPRTYYMRSAESVLIEGFAGLMYGLNRISYFISDSRKESPSLYARHLWKPLADAAPVLHGYAQAIDGCRIVGASVPEGVDPVTCELRRLAVPLVVGIGEVRGRCTAEDLSGEPCFRWTSRQVQAFRETIDRRCGGLPALVTTPFCGFMVPHADKSGALKTVALLNVWVDEQVDIGFALRGVPSGCAAAVWHELRKPPVRLPLRRANGEMSVVIPNIAPRNAGYLSFE